MSLNRFRLLGTYAHWMLNAKLHGKNATVSFAWFKLISYNAAKRHLVQKQFSSMGCEFLFKGWQLRTCTMFMVHRLSFPPASCGLFYLACHRQCRAADPGRRPTGPFRLLCSVLSGRVKPWMYSRATNSGKTVCGTPARLPLGLFSAQDQIQDRCRLRCPRRKYVTGSPPYCEGARSAPRVLPHRKRP